MRLAQRLLLGSLAVITVLLLAIVVLAGGRLHERLVAQERDRLYRAARLTGLLWDGRLPPDSVADIAGAALGYRLTLIDGRGRVVGDSEFDGEALEALENHATRPEVRSAVDRGAGSATRVSASAGDEQMYAAVRQPLGVVRASIGTARLGEIVNGAERDVLIAALLAFAGAIVITALFARSVSRPIVELRDVATAIAGGDLTSRPALAGPGEIGDLAAALQTMTEQLDRRLAALREEDALLTALVEALNEGVLALNQRGRVVRVNDRAREFLRLGSSVAVDADRLPRNATLREAIESALAGHATEPAEIQVHGRTLAVTSRPLPAGGAIVALFDLTTIRRLELMRRDFVANVSHELKTPLTVVRGFAETLLEDAVSADDRRRFTEAIVSNAARMQRIVDDLLDLSRIESGRWLPKPVWVPLQTVTDEVFASVRDQAVARGVTLETSLDAARVYADSTALRQILANLVENAVRHTRGGRVVVRSVRVREQVELAVTDTGIGISPEHLPRIFERFYRVDPSRARADGGTGLGLSIVKHLAEVHGGSVRAASEPGRGTTVTVCLPDPA